MIDRLIDILLSIGEKETEGMSNKPGVLLLIKLTWVIEVYYLILCCLFLYEFPIKLLNNDRTQIFPAHVQMINETILSQLKMYYMMFIFLGIGVFVCGLIMSLYTNFPGFKYNPRMMVYSSYGIWLGPWLFLLGITYGAYEYFASRFPWGFVICVILLPLLWLVKFTRDKNEFSIKLKL